MFGSLEINSYLCSQISKSRVMKKVDLYLDKPINILGAHGTSYPGVAHIDTIHDGDEYVEDGDGEILYIREMDAVMTANVSSIIDQNT